MSAKKTGMVERAGRFAREHLTWLVGAALALLLIQDVFGTHGLIAMRRSMREATQTQQEIERINKENRDLEDHVKSLKSDPAAIERIAREEMGLARPGEYIFKIPAKPNTSGPAPADPSAPSKD